MARITKMTVSSAPASTQTGSGDVQNDIIKCVNDNDILGVAAILLNDPAKVHATDIHGDSPLHIAAFLGNLGMVELLLSQSQLNPLWKNARGKDALDVAIAAGHQAVKQRLLAHWESLLPREQSPPQDRIPNVIRLKPS